MPQTKIPAKPVYVLLLPKTSESWRSEIESGFRAAAEQFNMEWLRREFESESGDALSAALRRLPNANGAPVGIVFTQATAAKNVGAMMAGRSFIEIGTHSPISGESAYVSDAPENLVYRWSIRARQQNPPPKRVLVVFGGVPLQRERISAAFYSRSDNWKRYQLRIRNLLALTSEDAAWSDMVVALGESAVRKCAGMPNLVAVDTSDFALSLVRSGKALCFAPNYFQMGYRAARLAREKFLTGANQNPAIELDYVEVVPQTLDWYLARRHEIPKFRAP